MFIVEIEFSSGTSGVCEDGYQCSVNEVHLYQAAVVHQRVFQFC